MKSRLTISGMHCASCAVTIEKKISSLSGVVSIVVNYAAQQAIIVHDEPVSVAALIAAVHELGYTATDGEHAKAVMSDEPSGIGVELIVSCILSLLLFVGSMFPQVVPFLSQYWVLWALATPVQFWIARRFYVRAWRAARNGSANMHTLIVLGTSVAYFYSVCVVLFPAPFIGAGLSMHVYFDASAIIITFILLGNYLEDRARRRTSFAIKNLMQLQPEQARIKKADTWEMVGVQQVAVDDIMLIKPGERIPVDGIVVHGNSAVNESMITGESMSVKKEKTSQVIGGTISLSGALEVRAIHIGNDTMLAKIIGLVKEAQASKAPVQKLVDKISGIFVPVVIVLSIFSFVGWFVWGPAPSLLYAVVNMVSVLIIACPCALGLATPTSIMVGIGRGATEGILIKDVTTLEIAEKINVVIFDKTGTLTRGQQDVHAFNVVGNLADHADTIGWQSGGVVTAEQFLLIIVHAVDERSNHPISQAVVRYVEGKVPAGVRAAVPEITNFETLSGLGIRGDYNGHTVLIGSRRLMEDHGVTMPEKVNVCATRWSQEARSVSFIAINKVLCAYFCMADAIRDGAADAIAQLKKRGIEPVMLTGDNKQAASAVAAAVGIDTFFANVLPEDKAAYVTKMKAEKKIVAMVGDGINDAPALALADVGIAVGGGTDVALETAGVALLRNDIALVPKVITLSQATLYNIRQNLIWAFGYNILLIPVAMGVLYPLFGITLHPMVAGFAMASSSVSVILNALRLRFVTL